MTHEFLQLPATTCIGLEREDLLISCRVDQIGEALDHARHHLDKNLEWRWEGSVHECYPDNFRNPATDTMHLMVGVMPR